MHQNNDYRDVMVTPEEIRIRELEKKVIWLENRYKTTMKIVADAVANNLPLNLQQDLFLDIARRTTMVGKQELKANRKAVKMSKKDC